MTENDQESEQVSKAEKRFPVIEIFGPVIQGEGSQAGVQTMFVRFGGCDYRCTMCDSLHAVMPQAVQKHATYMDYKEITRQLEEAYRLTRVKWVTFSGGNPCMHKLDKLVDQLIYNGWHINVETQGTLWQEWLNRCTIITISPKSMGMGEKFEEGTLRKFLSRISSRPICVKIVVFGPQDLEMALHIKGIVDDQSAFCPPGSVAYYLSLGNPYPPVLNEELDLVENPETVWASNLDRSIPASSLASTLLTNYRELSEEVLQDHRLKDFRFLPQLHVLVYGNETGR